MQKNDSGTKTNNDEEIQQILEKGEKFYPISVNSQKTDDRCANLYSIENWSEVFYHLKEGESR